ncbi:GTPase IMAP family member GIMD1 [Cynoglossus semilaevis]|uniref:GTPase IMAP family member GIMD1 n=1 Tax=Cynoglossus semilaevis TaxID=244447 RepID=A0A3P8V5M2_CYNSE|nr:GTPase IMAP family member GIMD1 [Cynoglossus semilaevis]
MDSTSELRPHVNSPVDVLGPWRRHHDDRERNLMTLNVLLLGDRQSGRSSVGNALIGGHEFLTGPQILGVSTTTEYQVLSRNFPGFFRRQGAESDLTFRVTDTPPLTLLCPESLHQLCPDGVHVVVVVVRVDTTHEHTHLEQQLEHLFGAGWRSHALLVLTHADHLKKAGFQPSVFLTKAPDWLTSLVNQVKGGVLFLDNSSDWPLMAGQPVRDGVLRVSAGNQHRAIKVRTEVTF